MRGLRGPDYLAILEMPYCHIGDPAKLRHGDDEGTIGQRPGEARGALITNPLKAGWPMWICARKTIFYKGAATPGLNKHEQHAEHGHPAQLFILVDIDDADRGIHQDVDLVEEKGSVAVQ